MIRNGARWTLKHLHAVRALEIGDGGAHRLRGGGLAVPADGDAPREALRHLVGRAQHRLVGLDQHLDEGFGEPRLIAFAHGTEHDQIGETRGGGQLIAEAALGLAHGQSDMIGAHRLAHAFDGRAAADRRDRCLDALGRFVARVLRRLDDLLDHDTRDAIGEERERLAQVGANEEGNDMGVERARGGDGVGEHGRIARSAGHGGKNLGDRHVSSHSQTRGIIGRSKGAGNSSQLDRDKSRDNCWLRHECENGLMKRDAPARAWQRMLSGRRLDLLDPSPLDIEIEDIAHGLARVARWNGQTHGEHAFSVAQHCILVERLVGELRPKGTRPLRLAALLHDAAEYVIGDLISPFKAAVGIDYKALELRLSRAIHVRFGLPPEMTADEMALIKRADKMSAYFEATQLAGFTIIEARKFFGIPRGVSPPRLHPLPVSEAQTLYLERFRRLSV